MFFASPPLPILPWGFFIVSIYLKCFGLVFILLFQCNSCLNLTGAWALCGCGGLVVELQAVPGLWAVLHHGTGVTGHVLHVFSLRQMLFLASINLIHVSYFRSSHGTRQMSKEEITDCYGEKHIWTDFNSLEENPIQHCMSDIISHG